MSAIRNNSNRGEARKSRATPYARIVVNKVFRFLGFVPAEEVQELREQHINGSSDTETDSSRELQNSASENRHRNINDNRPSVKHSHANGSRDPLTAASSFNAAPDPIPTIVPVPVHKLERSASERSMVVDKPQPRFTFTYTAPGSSSFSSLSELARDQTPMSSAKKKLERNPNGIYRWEGGGSAKRPRNRYSSPAFGASPVKPSRVVMADHAPLGTNPLSDTKRRKEDEMPQTPPLPFPLTASPSSQTNGTDNPGSASPRANGTVAKARESSPVSRLRTPAKPTAPANPSPLRQAWSDPAPSPKDSKTGSSQANASSQPKQSKTANLMAELIKETTPAKKPDLSNPYQTASPLAKIGPPRRGNKRTRDTGKPAAPANNKSGSEQQKADAKKEKDLSEYSQQAIIEATLPKGSKRSRPPVHFDDIAASSSNADRRQPPVDDTRKQVYTVEEPDVDDKESPRKKAKPTLNGHGLPSSFGLQSPSAQVPDVTIEEISDVVMDDTKEKEKEVPKVIIPTQSSESAAGAGSPTTRNPFVGLKPSSIPKEPSKLRFSFQAEGTSAPPSPAPSASVQLPQSTPPPLPKSDFKFSPPSNNFEFKFKVVEKPISPTSQPEATETVADDSRDAEVKAKVRAMNSSTLPVFNITLISTSKYPDTEEHVSARNRVKLLSESSLPVFEFGPSNTPSNTVPFSFGFDPSNPKSPSQSTRKFTPPKLTKPFESNSGISLPKVPAPVFTFADSDKAAIPVGESSKPSAPPVKGFDFAAAGMKVPTVAKDTWQCSLCCLSNPTTATKCETCETPNPKAAPAAPPVKGFDFAAAGMKVPSVSKDTWQCSLCSLSNPTSATKCETCETPNPKAAPTAPLVKGFDYAAAGMKAPAVKTGTWACSLCGLSSPESASQCVTCENPR